MAYFVLGIDGGQSSTTALIGDPSGRVVGYGRGGPCNHVGASEGRAKFEGAILTCVGEACRQAGLDPATTRFAACCAGFSGGPADKERLLAGLVRAERFHVTHDGLIALSGATAGAPGIVVIGGTGSLAFGRNAEGKTARAGGWGYVFGDEGSGFDLTRQALRAALRHEEGWGPPTSLHAALLAATGAADANDLLHCFYTTEFPRPRIASLSQLVDEAARNGDAVARGLLEQAGHSLAVLANALRSMLFEPASPVLIAYIGGVFRSAILLDAFRAAVGDARVQAPLYGPAAGALIEAYRALGARPALSNVPENEK
jgi:N-acetylglucosamine kinase-like BadF-type ATPase